VLLRESGNVYNKRRIVNDAAGRDKIKISSVEAGVELVFLLMGLRLAEKSKS